MPKKLDDCVKSVMADGKTESQAYAICNAQFKDGKINRQFADRAVFDGNEKTAISVRDGILEYEGRELGLEPADKIFTVYRSPATIANAATAMSGIPVTNEHIEIDGPAPETGSAVETASMIDQVDEDTHSRIAIKNKLKISDDLAPAIKQKRELSLGYNAELVPHDKWDFEQINIVPHHLAAVPAGRCGPLCSFLDRKPPKHEDKNMPLPKQYLDADGAVSLEKIVEMTTALPEAIKKVPVDQMKKILPSLQKIMEYAKAEGAEMPVEEEAAMEETVSDEDMEEVKTEEKEVLDEENKEEMKDEDKEEKPKFSDADLQRAKHKFADEQVKIYAKVVNKARDFMDASYDFENKSANEIMSDVLKEWTGETFADNELSTAFKLLKKQGDYKAFGDAKESGLEARVERDLKGE